MTRASAPGKVVLSGEYAVLDGAPAIAMAVNRRAMVAADVDGQSRLRCLGLRGDVDRSLLDCVVRVCASRKADLMSFVLDTRAFMDAESGNKLGIGSSAALCVALVRALSPDSAAGEVMQAAAEAHREFQGGIGSGIDIATSTTGGLLVYQRGEADVSTLSWPDGLHYALLWSGVPADTGERIRRFDGAAEQPSRRALFGAAADAAAAWQASDAQGIVGAGCEYAAALAAFSADHDLGIFASGHAALMQKALDKNLLYKPCGAGGGDIGIALALSQSSLDDFVCDAQRSGFTALDVKIDTEGARIDA